MRKSISLFLIILLVIAFSNCEDKPNFPVRNVLGYRPIYATATSSAIVMMPPRTVLNPGKVVRNGNYLLVNESKQGIHVYDNSDPSSPNPLGFLPIEGNLEVYMEGNKLYVDHAYSLMTLDITDLEDIKLLSRTVIWSLVVPPDDGHYFECPDPAKGFVIGWEKVELDNPKCYRKNYPE